jgi:hypothetical protein
MQQAAHSQHTPAVLTVRMFSVPVRTLWFLVLAVTLVSELVPLSLAFENRFSPLTFYFFEAAKLLALFVFGLLMPLAWWQSKSMGIGVLFAIITTAIVEFGQAFIPGHRTSMFEMAVKLALLFTGFVAGLEVRAYQRFTLGRLCILFSSSHWSDPS